MPHPTRGDAQEPQWVPGSAGTPARLGAMLPHAGAGTCSSPHDSRHSRAHGPREAESAPRGQEGAIPSPCTRKGVVTYPCSISRLVVGCRHTLWELVVLCQRLLIARQAVGARGWGELGQGGPSSETRWSQHIAHANEPRPAACSDLPHQSRDAQRWHRSGIWVSGCSPRCRLAEDTSGDRTEVTLCPVS